MGRFFNKQPDMQDGAMLDSLGMGQETYAAQYEQTAQEPVVGTFEGRFVQYRPDGSFFEITPEQAAARSGYQSEEVPLGQQTFTESVVLPTKGRITASVTHTSTLDYESESPEALPDARFLALQQFMHSAPHLADRLQIESQYSPLDSEGAEAEDPFYPAYSSAPTDDQTYYEGNGAARQLVPWLGEEQSGYYSPSHDEVESAEVLSSRELRKFEKAAAKEQKGLAKIVTPETAEEAKRKARRAGVKLAIGVVVLAGVASIAERGQTVIYSTVAGDSSNGSSYWSAKGKHDTERIPLIGPFISHFVPTTYGGESKGK